MAENGKLSTEAKWQMLKFLGIFIAGAWAILFGLSYQFYSSLNEAAEAKIDLQVNLMVKQELEKFSDMQKKIESASERAIEANLRANHSAESAEKTVTQFDELRKKLPDAKATLSIVKKISSESSELVNSIVENPTFYQNVSDRISTLPVGSIVASILKPEDFFKVAGNTPQLKIWALADGKPIDENSTYATITGKNTLPDLRGVFLRGLNLGRNDPYKDPEGDKREAGMPQIDSIKKHRHEINPKTWSVSGSGPVTLTSGKVRANLQEYTDYFGEDETRPKNVAVFYYIKIR